MKPIQPTFKDIGVEVKARGVIGGNATITINGQIIPVFRAIIFIRPDELISVDAEILAKDIDVKALQSQTRITVIDETKNEDI